MGSDTRILEDLLIDIAYNGISYRRTEHLAIDRFEFTAPSIQLLNQISTIHTNIQNIPDRRKYKLELFIR